MVSSAVSQIFKHARTSVKYLRGSFHVPFGEHDDYPEKLLYLVQNSPSLATAVETKANFIAGDGIESINKFRCSDKYNFEQLINTFAYQASALTAIAAHIRFNALGEIVETTPVPPELVRYRDQNLNSFVVLPPNWLYEGTAVYSEATKKVYNEYNPEKVFEEMVECGGAENHNGQILYKWIANNDSFIYPRAMWHGAIQDALVEAELKKSKFRDVYNGFAPRILITEYATGEQNQKQRDSRIEEYEKMLGSEGSGLLVQWATSKDAKTDIEQINSLNLDKLYEYAEKSSKESIMGIFRIPPTLYGVSPTSGIGDNKEMQNAVTYMQKIVIRREQALIENTIKELVSKFMYLGNLEVGSIKNLTWI